MDQKVPPRLRLEPDGRAVRFEGGSEAEHRSGTRGISDLVAIALCALDLNKVHRRTIAALMPEGQRPGQVQMAFRRALRRFDQYGWIVRGEHVVTVVNRPALLDWVKQGVDFDPARAAALLRVHVATKDIERLLLDKSEPARETELRRRELLALKRLMEQAPGATPTGRGSVRLVPRGQVI
jgi:hypothetical protein